MTSRIESTGRRLLVGWVDLVRRAAVPVLVAAVLLSAALLYYTVANIGMNTSTTDMLSAELPFRQNSIALKAAFPEMTDPLVIVVEAETADRAQAAAEALSARLAERTDLFQDVLYLEQHPFFRRHGLLYLEPDELFTLSDRLAEAQPLLATLREDMSLRGLAEVLVPALESGEAPAPAFGRVLDRMARTAESVAQGAPRPLPWRELLSADESVDPEDRRALITVRPALDFASLEPVAPAVGAIRADIAALGLAGDPTVRVRLTGEPLMLQEELRSVQSGIGFVGLLSLLLVLGLLAVGLRSAPLVAATLLSLLIGLIWTAAFATAAVGDLNVISVAFAVLFIGLSVDFGIHFALRYKEAIDAGRAPAAAPGEAAAGIGGALVLSAVAAAAGFLSFLPTAYRGVSELGLISGVGMFIALFVNLTVLPAVLALLPARPAGKPRDRLAAGGRLSSLVQRHARRIVVGAAVLGALAAAALPFAQFDEDPLNLRDPDSESVATLLDLMDDPRVSPYDARVLAPDLEGATALATELERLPEVESARTLRDFVPENQDEKLAIIEEMAFSLTPILVPGPTLAPPSAEERRQAVGRLRAALREAEGALQPPAHRLAEALGNFEPDDLQQLEQALLGGLPALLDDLAEALSAAPVELDDLPEAIVAPRLAADGRAVVQIVPAQDLRNAEARRRFVEAVQRIAPTASGDAIIAVEASAAVIGAFREAAIYALGLISLLLLVVLRRVRECVLLLSPLALAALLTVAATVLLDMPFNFANMIVLPLLLGLGVAAGIQIVLRARGEAPGRLMLTSTPRAVVFSALTTIGSFGALALSSHPGTASMGALLTISIGLTMLCALIVLPALLAWSTPKTLGRHREGTD